MFNNEVTYDKKWDTEENKAWQKKVEDRFFDKSICSPSCPTGWAKEVYELLAHLDDEFGIRWNSETIRAYRVQGHWAYLLSIGPFVGAVQSLYTSMVGYRKMGSFNVDYYGKMKFSKKVYNAIRNIPSVYRYGLKAFRVQVTSHIMNWWKEPIITLSQVKEKYGRLEIYFSAPDYLDEYVEEQIAKAQVKLAIKGAYYPLDSMYDYSVGRSISCEHSPDDVMVEQTSYGKMYYKTTHRKAMKELGVDTTEMAKKSTFGKEKEEEVDGNEKLDKSV